MKEGGIQMGGSEKKSFGSPEETRSFENGRIELVHLDGGTVGRYTFEPGWRWTNDVKPIAGTESCRGNHLGYVVSGRLHVRMDDGAELEASRGDGYHIAPGHDAWVVGDETFVGLEFQSETAAAYARR